MGRRIAISICLILILFFLYNHLFKTFPFPYQQESVASIGIFLVANDDVPTQYDQYIDSLSCYAYRHGYRFILISPKHNRKCIEITENVFFQKHCLVSTDSSLHLILYERFNGEVAAGNYLIHNHRWSHRFLVRWMQYEQRTKHFKFHNSDNGALHMHLLADMVGNVNQSAYDRCFRAYENASDPTSYHTFIGCCKCALGGRWEFEHLRILRRGHSFVRDNLGYEKDKRIWSPTDFLIHGHKQNIGTYYSKLVNRYRCFQSNWFLPVRKDVIMTNFTQVKETIRSYDQAAATAYPQSVGLPDVSDCWPNCLDTVIRRQAFVEKVCHQNASWRSL